MRLFVAVPVPTEVRDGLARAVAAWRARASGPDAEAADGWRWTRPEGWHVTVAFLGEVDDADVPQVESTLVAGARIGSPLTLRLGEVGRFGARVLYVEVLDDPPGALARLGEGVQAALADAGLPVQRREVRGHLTLARSTRRRRIDHLPRIAFPARAWTATQAVLEASRPQPGGARYTTLATVPLTG
jgi:RNA 2',3'-cyclic 3'-phosphodiesterase